MFAFANFSIRSTKPHVTNFWHVQYENQNVVSRQRHIRMAQTGQPQISNRLRSTDTSYNPVPVGSYSQATLPEARRLSQQGTPGLRPSPGVGSTSSKAKCSSAAGAASTQAVTQSIVPAAGPASAGTATPQPRGGSKSPARRSSTGDAD